MKGVKPIMNITTKPPMSAYEKSLFLKAWKEAIPKFDPRFTNGAVLIFGTGGEIATDEQYHLDCGYCKDTFWSIDAWAEFCPDCVNGKK